MKEFLTGGFVGILLTLFFNVRRVETDDEREIREIEELHLKLWNAGGTGGEHAFNKKRIAANTARLQKLYARRDSPLRRFIFGRLGRRAASK